MHGNGTVDRLTDLPVAQEIILRYGRLEHGHIVVSFQPFHDRNRGGRVPERAVRVQVQLEMRRHNVENGFHLDEDIPPRAQLDLEAGIPFLHGVLRLGGPLFGRGVAGPPGDRCPLPHLRAHQLVGRYLQNLSDHVEKGHLQAGAEGIVVHPFGRALPQYPCHTLIRHPSIGIMDDGLAPTDMPGIRGDLTQLQDRPVVYRPNRDLLLSRRKGHIDDDAFDINDFHGVLLSSLRFPLSATSSEGSTQTEPPRSPSSRRCPRQMHIVAYTHHIPCNPKP